MTRASTTWAAAAGIAVAVLSGCAPGGPTPTQSGSPTPTPTPTSAPTETTEPTGPAPEPTSAALTVYLVRVGDDGASGEAIGCGDSLVPVETPPIATDDALRAAIVQLLEAPEGEVVDRGLVNPVAGGTLDYVAGGLEADGTVRVELTGRPLLGGECDDPRIEAQLEGTAMAATGADEAHVFIDGVRLEDFLRLD